ncbi:MAG: pectate lyase [Balneolaceae bacterium]
MKIKSCTTLLLLFLVSTVLLLQGTASAQSGDLQEKAEKAMLEATRYMVGKVSTHGGYLRLYTEDLTRRWGELEAYDTQIMLTYGRTPSMGHLFLDAWHITGNEYYYEAAEGVARVLIWGQHETGGWDYIIDFAGDRSLKQWFGTIGKNAWGWNEYNNYYGTPTFKNGTTTEAARFLLRIYLEKLDPAIRPALDKAVQFVLDSQYPLGGWPQRHPEKRHHSYEGKQDYTYYYVFNDDLAWENIEFLIQCYNTLGDERLLDPIRRGMNFYLIAQQGNPQGGWAEQYTMDLEPAHGRPYEPASLMPGTTYRHVRLLMTFYRYTGDQKFLSGIKDAIEWLESSRLPEEMSDGGRFTHPVFVEIGTGRPLFAHREGTGRGDGRYWVDYRDDNPLLHYGSKMNLDLDLLREEYEELKTFSPEKVTAGSPLRPGRDSGERLPEDFREVNSRSSNRASDEQEVRSIIESLDEESRWLTTGEWISRPYSVSEDGSETNTALMSTEGGSAIRDSSGRQYISTTVYMRNMRHLLNYLAINKHSE